jgi:hypothetical protein
VQSTVEHELDDIAVRHGGRSMHLLVIRQQLPPPALIPDEEFSEDELMPAHFVATQESVKLCRKWCAI